MDINSNVTKVTSVQDNAINDSSVTDSVTEIDEEVTESLIPQDEERPCYRVFDEWYEEKDRKWKPGVWYFYMTPGKKGELPAPAQTWICSPLHIHATTFDSQDNNFGRLLRFSNPLKKWRQWAMPMELLKGSGEELRGELLSMGVEIDPKSRTYLASYLQSQHPKRQVRCALQVGWCDSSFVLPDKVYGKKAFDIIFQSGERSHDEYTVKGSVEGWKNSIAKYAIGNPTLMLALSSAFAGALLKPCNAESGGFHFVGDSSTGKTCLIEAACSVWGGENFKRSWRSTANGLESIATLFNHGLLALDEISECDPKEVGAIVYSLGNGKGKQRASRTGNAKSVKRWECFYLIQWRENY